MSPASAEMIAWSAVAAVGMGVGLGGLIWASRRGRLLGLPPQRLRAAPWNGLACLGAFLVLWGPQQFAIQWLALNRIGQLMASVLLLPLQLLVLWMAFRAAFDANPYPGGQNLGQWKWHAVAGFGTWLLAAPLTLVIHAAIRAVMVQFGEPGVSDHPLIVVLQNSPGEYALWLLIALEAIVGAPLREEVFFRGVVQPWAIRRPWAGEGLVGLAAILGYLAAAAHAGSRLSGALAPVFVAGFWLLVVFLTRRFPTRPELSLVARWLFPPLTSSALSREQVVRGIAATSILFAMTHAGSWPDPVPLTVLSLGLGWLAFRTQSLVGPVVCHALFNAMTIYQLRVMTLLSGAVGTS